MTAHELWYDRPAQLWTEALPLGNGRLGAMCFGGTQHERFQINDATAWSGSPASESTGLVIGAAEAEAVVREARVAIGREDYASAQAALMRLQHRYSQSYLPFVDVELTVAIPDVADPAVSDYQRHLDLRTATHLTSYLLDGFRVTQRSWISRPHGVMVVEVETEHPKGVDLSLALSSQLRVLGSSSNEHAADLTLQLPSDVAPSHDSDAESVTYSEDPTLAMRGAAVVRWETDGESVAGDGLQARSVRRASCWIATATTFVGLATQPEGDAELTRSRAHATITAALAAGMDTVRAEQLIDHSDLYERVEVDFRHGATRAEPIDERLRIGNANVHGVVASDPQLAALLFHYGRYLLICSSRVGGVPANLQGIWNDQLQPPWSSNYTTNINVQMNYWQAEPANLPECAPPLYDLIDALSRTGSETAKRLYGAPGWVAHHNTDIWGYSQPVGRGAHDPKWAFWPLASAWLVRALWDHLEFGADDDFARTRAWPPIRSAAEFALHWLQPMPDGSLGTSPSTSPENQFVTEAGMVSSVGQSSTLDLILIGDLLDMVTTLASRLGLETDAVVTAAHDARQRIPDVLIARDGGIAEWLGDFDQPDPTHRHVSQLYFAYPGTRSFSPDVAEAAAHTLDTRGDESTGWSLAWKLALRARLGHPHKISDLLRLVFRDMDVDRGEWVGGLYPNLLAAHPPFQIDGNFGYVAGLTECLVQSHRGTIEVLRAVPPELAAGSVRGLVARPGVEVDIVWAPNRFGRPSIVSATLRPIRSAALGRHMVVFDTARVAVDLSTIGVAVTLTGSDFEID